MKKLMTLLLCLSLALSFAACGKKTDAPAEAAPSAQGQQVSDVWGITLTAKNVTAKGMTLACTQKGGSSEGQLETSSKYWIEKREENRWVELEPQSGIAWDMMAHLIPSGETVEWELDWTWIYGELGAGRYRICKTIVDYKESGAGESRNYCAEFEIK